MRTFKFFLGLIGAAFFALPCFCDCIQISKQECEALKAQMETSVSGLNDSYASCREQFDRLSAAIYGVNNIYGRFTAFYYDNYSQLQELPYYDYYISADSIYQDFTQVQNDMGDAIASLEQQLDAVDNQLPSMGQAVTGLNCEPCSEQSEPGGGGGDCGGGEGGGSGDCPCAAAIASLQIILQHIDGDLHEIKQRLDYWDRYIKMLEEIRDKTESLDDFMHDDLRAFLVQFSTAFYNEPDFHKVNPAYSYYKLYTELMARSWFYSDYTNATEFINHYEGKYDFEEMGKRIFIGQSDVAKFDFAEYSKFNWFQRMEFLLANLTGIFSSTNVVADLTEEQKKEAEDQEQAVNDAFGEGAFSDSRSLVGGLLQRIESAQGKLNPFHGLFSSSHSAQPIEILPETGVTSVLVQGTSPGFYLDTSNYGSSGFGIHTIVDVAHNLTTFIYLVFFLVVDIFAFVFFVRGLIAIVQWYHKIVLSWVKTFNVR